jgi:PIN domain nuclease of toxin-antitoxin system
MKALLDTHTFLWWITDDPSLSIRAREVIADGQNEIFLSAATVWEIVLKAAKGRLILPEPPGTFISSRMRLYRFQTLPIQISHVVQVYELPLHHNDPFDRMLIAQSCVESLPLVTKDEEIKRYELEIIW